MMSQSEIRAARDLGALFRGGTVGDLPDGDLLGRVAGGSSEASRSAFDALVRRHGPMVGRVCRSALGDAHDAEDAFQATFLILWRRAGSIRAPGSVACWLHGVALRVASDARAGLARRRSVERRGARGSEVSSAEPGADEVGLALQVEVGRLPALYRQAVVLCHLEGLTHEEAARQLGCPVGTVRSRLARGRARLRDRLARRGLAPAVLGPARAVSEALIASTNETALHAAGGRAIPEAVVQLMKGALGMKIIGRLKTLGIGAIALGLLALGASALGRPGGPDGPEAGRPVEVIGAGPLTLEVRIARTANLFHVVDQLAGWSEFCHAQYRRHFEADGGLSDRDSALLARHAAIRRVRGWGAGLEQVFYTDKPLDDALAEGVKLGRLTAEEAAVEREVLEAFAPRVDGLLREHRATLEAFRDRLGRERERLGSFAGPASRLFGGARPTVPVFLIANPSDDDIGGGFNGGRLTLEVPGRRDAYPSFLHELFHAFVDPHRPALREAVAGMKGLDEQTLNEGLAYALAPGIFRDEAGPADPLRDKVAADLRAKAPLGDSYARFNRYGLALRPVLRRALEDRSETLETLLPRAVDAWRSLAELSAAIDGRPGRPTLYSFGPGWQVLARRASEAGSSLRSFNHRAEHYEKALADAEPGSTLVFLLALDQADRAVPEAFRPFLPRPLPAIEAELAKGKTLELAGMHRGYRTILLAAPTARMLDRLIQQSALIGEGRPIVPR